MKYLVILFILFGAFSIVNAQERPLPSSRESGVSENKQHPEHQKSDVSKKSKSNKITVYYDVKVQEFYDRMEANAKKYEKMEKEMKKPQYSDPLYFGHKKPPKKRAPGNKKFCHECGIRH